MAKEFTNVQSIESVMAAINAVASGKSDAECKAAAATAIHTVKNSNSMVLAESVDKAIEMEELLEAAENHVADGTDETEDGEEILPPPVDEDDDNIPY